MENTGRIKHTVKSEIRDILYGKKTGIDDTELFLGTDVDCVHLIMLKECGLLESSVVTSLLSVINDLRNDDFKKLAGRDESRGQYILYEDFLIEKLGMETAGNIQLARSRNDRNATVIKLHIRKSYISLINELFNLQDSLLKFAAKFSEIVMPVYTHYQAAQPIVLGHYLAGIAEALNRDISNLLFLQEELNHSPLGAGAVAGTSVKINTARTAELLGFSSVTNNSIDSIASRDYVLRILSCMSIIGTTLSRYASDLLLWSTSEFNMIEFPDELVGSSSMMPQKRNAFILEHIQGNTKALGAFVAATTAQQSTPFSNSIAVNSASVLNFWNAADELISAIILMRFMTEGIIPNKKRMLKLSEENFTVATAAADRLNIQAGIPFREAHKIIGAIIKNIIDGNSNDRAKLFIKKLSEEYPKINWQDLTPENVAATTEYGGGPGKISLKRCLSELNLRTGNQKKEFEKLNRFWTESGEKLRKIVAELIKN